MSYFSQIGALTVAAVRHARPSASPPAIALVRGFSRRNSPTIGNFWVDITRGLLYILLPIAFVAGIIFVGQGAVQTAGRHGQHPQRPQRGHPDHRPGPGRLHGGHQAAGHQRRRLLQRQLRPPLREPDRPHQLLSIFLLLAIPFALTYTFGKMVGSAPPGRGPAGGHGDHLRGLGRLRRAYAEHQANPAVASGRRRAPADRATPRARRSASATPELGAVRGGLDPDLDRLGRRLLRLVHPDGRLRPAHRHDAGRGHPGRAGQRPVHDPHLRHHRRVHRRPDDRPNAGVPGQEDPGHGGEAGRPGAAGHADHRARRSPRIAVSLHAGRAGPLNAGPHGFTEILYALTSQGNNNGSAFGGLTGNTPFYNVVGGIDMLIGRFGIMIPALALGGVLAAKNVVPAVARHLPHRQRHVRRPGYRRHHHHRRPDLLPRRLARSDRRAAQSRKVLLMTVIDHRTRPTPSSGRRAAHGVAEARGLFDREILRRPWASRSPSSTPGSRSRTRSCSWCSIGIGHHLHRGHRPSRASSPGRSPSGCSSP